MGIHLRKLMDKKQTKTSSLELNVSLSMKRIELDKIAIQLNIDPSKYSTKTKLMNEIKRVWEENQS